MVVLHIFVYPFKIIGNILRKILLKPIAFVFINIRKNLTSLWIKLSKIHIKIPKKQKKYNKRRILENDVELYK